MCYSQIRTYTGSITLSALNQITQDGYGNGTGRSTELPNLGGFETIPVCSSNQPNYSQFELDCLILFRAYQLLYVLTASSLLIPARGLRAILLHGNGVRPAVFLASKMRWKCVIDPVPTERKAFRCFPCLGGEAGTGRVGTDAVGSCLRILPIEIHLHLDPIWSPRFSFNSDS